MTRDEALQYVARLPIDEQCFILRAQDALAPQTIRYWARGLQQVNDGQGKMIQVDEHHSDYDTVKNHNDLHDRRAVKAAQALTIAEDMEQWDSRKIPD